MTDRSSAGCPPESLLHDLVDERLDAEAAAALHAHLEGCAHCAALRARLLALRAGARALPREVAPPAELWGAIAAEIDARRVLAPGRMAWWRRTPALAAAALLLVALTATGTALVMRERAPVAVASAPASPATEPTPGAPAALRAIDRRHEPTIDELTRLLAKRRGELSPETVAAVERSLAIVDQALAEARDALARDPGNATLGELVTTVYRHKVTVLRRAAELEPRS